MVSRSFGVEIGAAIGIPLFLSQAVGVAFYVVGFTESFMLALPQTEMLDARFIGRGALCHCGAYGSTFVYGIISSLRGRMIRDRKRI